MGKLKTERISISEITTLVGSSLYGGDGNSFSYDINVDKEGLFSTTLPAEIVAKFEAAGVELKPNRLNNKGYFSDKTYEGLKKQVAAVVAEYLSRELVSEAIVIKYVIQTQCAYSFNDAGDIIPNCGYEFTGRGHNDPGLAGWSGGTVDMDATHRRPFGIQVYAKPFFRRSYKYKSGVVRVEYDRLQEPDKKDRPNLAWLDGVVGIAVPDAHWGHKDTEGCAEIEYTEEVAEFFVNLLTSICKVNERIKDFLTPDAIRVIAQNKTKLLG